MATTKRPPEPDQEPEIAPDEEEEIELYDDEQEIDPLALLAAGQYKPGLWIYSPDLVELFAATDVLLTQVLVKRGGDRVPVQAVRPGFVRGKNMKLYLIPAVPGQPNTFPVKRSNGRITINLREFLAPKGFVIDTGYQQRYDVAETRPGAKIGAALVVNLNKIQERRLKAEVKAARKKKAQQKNA